MSTFANKVGEMVLNELQEMSIEQLSEVIAECNGFTTTNCWWAEYDLRNVLRNWAEEIYRIKSTQQSVEPTVDMRRLPRGKRGSKSKKVVQS